MGIVVIGLFKWTFSLMRVNVYENFFLSYDAYHESFFLKYQRYKKDFKYFYMRSVLIVLNFVILYLFTIVFLTISNMLKDKDNCLKTINELAEWRFET